MAIIAACGLAAWLEERVFVRFVGRSSLARVLAALLMPLAFLLSVPLVGVTLGLLNFIGDDGTTGLSVVIAGLWATSAAVGTLVVVLIDVVVSAVVQSLRGRIQLAVLSLVGVATLSASGLALIVGNTGDAVRYLSRRTNMALDLGSEGTFRGEGLAQVMNRPEVVQLVSVLLLVTFALMAFPAVLPPAASSPMR